MREGGCPYSQCCRCLSAHSPAGRPESRLLKPLSAARPPPPPPHSSRRTFVRADGGAREPRTGLRERGERRHAGPTRGSNFPRPGREWRPEAVRPGQRERGKGGDSQEGARKPGWGAECGRKGEGARQRRTGRESRRQCGERGRGGEQVEQGSGQRGPGPACGRGEAGRGSPGGRGESRRRGREAPGNSRTTGRGDSAGAPLAARLGRRGLGAGVRGRGAARPHSSPFLPRAHSGRSIPALEPPLPLISF